MRRLLVVAATAAVVVVVVVVVVAVVVVVVAAAVLVLDVVVVAAAASVVDVDVVVVVHTKLLNSSWSSADLSHFHVRTWTYTHNFSTLKYTKNYIMIILNLDRRIQSLIF
jgi:hypothetical protein